MKNLKKISLLILLLMVIPAWGETVGLDDVREAVALWDRVFVRVPTLEQYIQQGKPLEGANLEVVGAALKSMRREESSNPFFLLARGVLTVLKQGPFEAAAAGASAKAGDRVAVRWLLYRTYLRLGEREAADHELRQIRDVRDRLGLDRISYIGWDLVRMAEGYAAHGDRQGAEDALALAEDFAPDDPRVLFARARIFLPRGSPGALRALMKGWWVSLSSPFYGPSRWANILASSLLAIPLGLLFVGLLLILRVTPLFKHDLAEWTRRRYSPATLALLPITLYFLPIIFGLGLLPAVLLCLLPLGIYMTGRERLLVGALVLSLLLLPGGYGLVATVLTSTSSPRFEALLQVEEGNRAGRIEAALRQWAEEAPHDLLPRFYLGRVHRTRGKLKQAGRSYSDAQALAPHEGAIWNNRGNLAFLAGDLPQAQSAYQKAIGLSPKLPQPHFNLSQVFTEQLLLEQAQQEYAQAMREMPSLGDRLQQAEAEDRKLVAVDAPLPAGQAWRQLLYLDTPSPEMAEFLWGERFLGVPLATLPWVVGGYLLAFGVTFWLRKQRRFARACQECGKAFCPRCQRVLGEVRLCTRCAIIQRARTGDSTRALKNIPNEAPYREPRWLGPALALIPGMERMYRGRTVWGFLLLATTLVVVSPLLGQLLTPATYLTGHPLPYTVPASLFILICLYLLAAATYNGSRRTRPGNVRWH
ncbi:MAG: hypothetical protein ACE5JQ_09335 [Candidatus Methylomirabilales bacterium]